MLKTDSPERTLIGRDDVIDAMERVCTSAAFVRGPQLVRLLKFLVCHALESAKPLKAYTIGVEGLGRPDQFDPEHDSIVRVQAVRLRRALDAYYETYGASDPIRIRLPTGSYNVAFEARPITAADPPRPDRTRIRVLLSFGDAGIAVAVAVALLLMLAFVGYSIGVATNDRQLGNLTVKSLTGSGLPTVVIRRFVFQGPPERYGLHRFIASAFARFETVSTVYEPFSDSPASAPINVDAEIRYDLTTDVVPDGDQTHLRFQLSDPTDASVVWARSFIVPKDYSNPAVQTKIVRTLASTLLGPYGVIASRERARHLHSNKGDPRYRCLLRTIEARRKAMEADYAEARDCLESTIKLYPTYSLAYAYLSSIHSLYFQYALDSEPSGQVVLDKGLWAARRAVQTNPTSAIAQFALYLALSNRRDFEGALEAFDKARALNEFNMVLLAQHAGRLITRGKVDEGMWLLEEIDDAFASRTCTHEFYNFLGHYLRGDRRNATFHADQVNCQAFPSTYLAKALIASAAGNIDDAKQAIENLRVLLPVWRNDPDRALRRMFPDAGIADRIKRDLAPAGL
jgi:tetratricopeptide (TPR) repeat protein